MLDLIPAHGDAVRVEHQYVGRHEHRVAEKPHRDACVDVLAARGIGFDKGLVCMGAVHEALRAHAVEHPVQQGDFGDVALAVQRDVFGIKACGKPAGGNLHAASLKPFGILALDQGMQVGEEKEAFHIRVFGGLHAGAQGAAIVSKVKCSGRVDAGKNAFGHDRKNSRMNR